MKLRILGKVLLTDDFSVPIRVKVLEEICHFITHRLIHMRLVFSLDTLYLRIGALLWNTALINKRVVSLSIHPSTVTTGKILQLSLTRFHVSRWHESVFVGVE